MVILPQILRINPEDPIDPLKLLLVCQELALRLVAVEEALRQVQAGPILGVFGPE
jgi:hypothetical protein